MALKAVLAKICDAIRRSNKDEPHSKPSAPEELPGIVRQPFLLEPLSPQAYPLPKQISQIVSKVKAIGEQVPVSMLHARICTSTHCSPLQNTELLSILADNRSAIRNLKTKYPLRPL